MSIFALVHRPRRERTGFSAGCQLWNEIYAPLPFVGVVDNLFAKNHYRTRAAGSPLFYKVSKDSKQYFLDVDADVLYNHTKSGPQNTLYSRININDKFWRFESSQCSLL
jgi:hypothetical protein